MLRISDGKYISTVGYESGVGDILYETSLGLVMVQDIPGKPSDYCGYEITYRRTIVSLGLTERGKSEMALKIAQNAKGKIEAIKYLRHQLGEAGVEIGLKEAKDYVEETFIFEPCSSGYGHCIIGVRV
jgi:hypothetical protein